MISQRPVFSARVHRAFAGLVEGNGIRWILSIIRSLAPYRAAVAPLNTMAWIVGGDVSRFFRGLNTGSLIRLSVIPSQWRR